MVEVCLIGRHTARAVWLAKPSILAKTYLYLVVSFELWLGKTDLVEPSVIDVADAQRFLWLTLLTQWMPRTLPRLLLATRMIFGL